MTGEQIHRFPFFALGCPNDIQLGNLGREEAATLFEALRREVVRIEHKFSRYRPDSIISRINSAAGRQAVPIDAETAGLLSVADACFEQSRGMFDLTSGVLRRVWNFKERRVPSPDEVKQVLRLIGWRRVRWDSGELFLPEAGMELDFGAIGKEYAVDRLAAIVLNAGGASALINLGGDVRVVGSQPDGTPWRIGISHPREEGKVLSLVAVRGGAVATSGDYERFFIADGKRYCHLLSPRTGYPVSELQSVSIFGESCLICGALATSAMLLGRKRGAALLEESDLPYILVTAEGKVITGGKNVPQLTASPEIALC